MIYEAVKIGEIKSTQSEEKGLKIFGLGSCVGLLFHCRKLNYATLAHIALPNSNEISDRHLYLPGYFADIAVNKMLDKFKLLGILRNNEITVKMVGGSNMLDENNFFNIGRRNIVAIKKILWDNNMGAIREDLGGHHPRTVSFDLKTGMLSITSGDYKLIEI